MSAGPRRELPDARAHELFEMQARERPDAIAAVHGDRQLTYRELNARANQIARALLARGLTREGIVGVMTERNLDWMTAVLAIFKAGGVYLPIEPHFLLGQIYMRQGRLDEARKEFLDVVGARNEAALPLAVVLRAQGDTMGASKWAGLAATYFADREIGRAHV